MNWYLDVLKNYAGFSGRARRKEYWMFVLFNFIIGVVLSVIGTAIDTQIPYYLYLLAVLVPSLAVLVRRLHDTGRSGWWFFIAFVPLVGFIILIVFLASEGKPETNQHGANPKLAPQGI
ncbi:DUF805 domain-containing protein [Streptomyces fimicarius]|uniref:DUF805 domain-containing protein n=1 Tax=Streptomyces TaxID=1883 RepID=UPI0004CBC2D2|nr:MULTISPECIES: DUF805 domain-containing protein [Streptomyces]MCX4710207.1 DUF805 domain-containing protein [Streptomyces griseus]MDX2669402.1 DUF805 domain-containing protein [Streptomyces sp. NRRL_ISP-5395]MDX3337313.1 DUF805 domain-containing protein [Streptomyces sp. ME02-6979.5a]QXQ98121.1 DUF805 domain-containing protein [Streptomyces sp. WY228]WKN15989.1 DUF805 domain-containing protein [Streptomyces sp. JUS-F4]